MNKITLETLKKIEHEICLSIKTSRERLEELKGPHEIEVEQNYLIGLKDALMIVSSNRVHLEKE